MTLLQPSDVPSMDGINDAITSEIADHASLTNPAGPHYDSGWVTYPKVGAAASMVNVVLEYRIRNGFIEWRTSGATVGDISVPASGDLPNQNITTGVPATMRPAVGSWAWTIIIGPTATLQLSSGGTVTLGCADGRGVAYVIPGGFNLVGTSPAFALP
jgi:hypothetical protein